MTLKEQLLRDAEKHCDRNNISLARLATIVANDGKFFKRLGEGGGFTTRTYEKFQAFFRDNKGVVNDETGVGGQ